MAVHGADAVIAAWTDALVARHTRDLTTPEFLKAVRALSARYVERRRDLAARSPIDSAGKRAAFAAFFAPLHLVTVRGILAALGPALPPVTRILDLGCGTGAASAAWALAASEAVPVTGIDQHAWSLAEAAWNWRALGLSGRTSRGDLVMAAADAPRQPRSAPPIGLILGWSVNELPPDARQRLLPALLARRDHGDVVLVIEPIARSTVPWWDEWVAATVDAGGRADEWKLDASLPPAIAAFDKAAGFRRDALGARSLLLTPTAVPSARAESAGGRSR